MTVLYVPWKVIECYLTEEGYEYRPGGALFRRSLMNDKITTVTLPDFLARAYRIFTRNILSKKVPDEVRFLPNIKEWKRYEYSMVKIEQTLLEEFEGATSATPSLSIEDIEGEIKYMQVAQRYVTTHLLLTGLYYLLDRILQRESEEEGTEDEDLERQKLKKILENLTLEKQDAAGVKNPISSRKLREYQRKVEFKPNGLKSEDYVITKICLPSMVHGFVTSRLTVTSLSSLLAYSIAWEGCRGKGKWFDESTKKWLRDRELPAFEDAISRVAHDLQQVIEVDLMVDEITNYETLKQHLCYYLRVYHGREPFTFNLHLPEYVRRYDLAEVFGDQAFTEVLRALRELQREGVIEEQERRCWVFRGE